MRPVYLWPFIENAFGLSIRKWTTRGFLCERILLNRDRKSKVKLTMKVDIALCLLFFLLLLGCSSEDGSRACATGERRDCVIDACAGFEECRDGDWSPCECESDEEEPSTPEPAALGTECTSDEDCPDAASCLVRSDTRWLGGAPPESFCVADCSDDASVCDEFSNAVCVLSSSDSDRALCLPACTLDDDGESCASIPGTACEPLLDTGSGFCRPLCVFDEDCASGHCDRATSTCQTSSSSSGLGFGESCTPESSSCAGLCLDFGDGIGLCSHRCVFGGSERCAEAELGDVCAYASVEGGVGDVGFCAPLCDCNDDCSATGFVCDAFTDPELAAVLGHPGLCSPGSGGLDCQL